MTAWISLSLWGLVSGILVAALTRGRGPAEDGSRSGVWRWLWRLIAVCALILFLRPHEDWLGGQDGGTYLSLGGRFAQSNDVIYTDPMLASIPTEARDYFRYFMHGPYKSKYGTEHIRDMEQAEMGPWFPPAYPLLISLWARLGAPGLMLLVIPGFAWINGLLLRRVVALLLCDAKAGRAAALLYWFAPLIIWHGRGPRPEFIASSLILSALACILAAGRRPRRRGARSVDFAVAGTAMALAPFFHVTAWMASLPLTIWVGVELLKGKQSRTAYPLPIALGFLAFCAQTLYWSDTYRLRRYMDPIFQYAPFWGIAAAIMALVCIGILSLCLFRTGTADPSDTPAVPYGMRHAGVRMFFMSAFLAGMTLWAVNTRPHVGIHYQQQFIYRTDVVAAADMLSRVWLLLAAGGLILLAGSRSRTQTRRAIPVLATLLLAAFSVGNMYDIFMMRYLVLAFVPLSIIGITVFLRAAAMLVRGARQPAAWYLSVLLLLLIAIYPRRTLITGREYRGLFRALDAITALPREEGAMMLVEYSRIGAPVEHIFGLPTLGLNNERIQDEAQEGAEQAWADLMRRRPDQPAYLLTAYGSPVSPHFVFEPVASEWVDSAIIQSRRWGLPRDMRPWQLSLNLFRMHLREDGISPVGAVSRYMRRMDSGRFGLRGFDLPHYKLWGVNAVPPDADGTYAVSWPASGTLQIRTLYLYFHSSAEQPAPALLKKDSWRAVPYQPLFDGWWMGHVTLTDPSAGAARIRWETQAVLNAVWLVDSQEGLLLRPTAEERTTPRMESLPLFGGRAARAEATATVPAYTGGHAPGLLLLLPEEKGREVQVRLTTQRGEAATHLMRTGLWLWTCWPGSVSSVEPTAFTLQVSPGAGSRSKDAPFHYMLGGVALPEGAAGLTCEK